VAKGTEAGDKVELVAVMFYMLYHPLLRRGARRRGLWMGGVENRAGGIVKVGCGTAMVGNVRYCGDHEDGEEEGDMWLPKCVYLHFFEILTIFHICEKSV